MQDDKIQEALVDLLYRQSYAVLFVNFVVPLPVVYILRDAVPTGWLLAWIGVMYAVTTGRILLALLFFKRADGMISASRWAWRATAFSWVSGLLWGLLGLMGFLPGEPHLLSFTIIVLTGLACGSVSSLAAFPPALPGSLAAMLVPVALRCFTVEGEIYSIYLFFLACLAGVNLYYGRVTYRMLSETVRLRSENVSLIGRLEQERDRAQAADHAKTRFLAAASHDLRQPIHALSLFISALAVLGQRGNVPAKDARDLASRAKSIVGNLSGLLNALLDMSRLDAGVVTIAREPVSLGELFRDFRGEFAAAAKEQGLDWCVVESDRWVDSDPMMLKRILDNLLSNAFRYTRDGRVLLGCRRRGSSVEIQVWDTGIGIPSDQREAVFEEFVQLKNPARDRTQGLGLGLAIVRRTAALLGHPLKLASVEGRGSMFSITVPLANRKEPKTAAHETSSAGVSLGIMVVDDELDILDAIRQLLTLEGHRIYAGRSAAEVCSVHSAAQKAGKAQVDLVIADYRLENGTTGLEAIRELCDYLDRSVAAIIVTGDTSPSRLSEVSASGYRLLHKPITGDDLRDAILKTHFGSTR